MELLEDPASAGQWCARQREAGRTLGFVPTMGALHEGHLSLARRSVAENARTCVSVFVNPLQFNEAADFRGYPRDLDGDAALLAAEGCTMVFTGTLEGFFPGETTPEGGLRPGLLLDAGPCARGLEGSFRPGHFEGVATIVSRLFEVVRPDRAYFGAKDFQQCLVVEEVARRLGFPEVVRCPTSREPTGLARSSRNLLLREEDRERAPALHRALWAARAAWSSGVREAAPLRELMLGELARADLEVEYAEVRQPSSWTAAEPEGRLSEAVALVAARLGRVRLIDNLRLDGGS